MTDPIETLDEPLLTWEQVVYMAIGAAATALVSVAVVFGILFWKGVI